MELLLLGYIGTDLHAVVVDLGVDSGTFNDHTSLTTCISNVDCEVAVVLGLRARFLLLILILI